MQDIDGSVEILHFVGGDLSRQIEKYGRGYD